MERRVRKTTVRSRETEGESVVLYLSMLVFYCQNCTLQPIFNGCFPCRRAVLAKGNVRKGNLGMNAYNKAHKNRAFSCDMLRNTAVENARSSTASQHHNFGTCDNLYFPLQ